MAKRVSSLDYIFAVGRIRALEKSLIPQAVFEDAIALDLAGALRLLVESDLYSDELLHIKNSNELEEVLTQELAKLQGLMRELILDKALLALLDADGASCVEKVLKTCQSDFLEDYLRHLIDMHNLKTFLRLYLLKEPQEKLKAYLKCQGFIPLDDLIKLYPQDLAALLNRLEYVPKHCRTLDYTYYLGEAVQKAAKENSFVYLEKAINDFLIQILKEAKYITFGPEPVLAYYLAKVNEINLMRMIIFSKLNNLSRGLVEERLNAVYA
jgi:V/A-type H+-transporting ATPase subunit C